MANERYPQDDYYNRSETQDYGRDYGSGRNQSYSSARDYQAAGTERGGRDRDRDDDGQRYGQREYGNQRYGQREQSGRGGYGQGGYSQGSYGGGDYGRSDYGRGDYDRGGYGQSGGRDYGRADRDFADQRDSGYYQDRGQGGGRSGGSDQYRGSYASDGRRFENVGRYRDASDDDRSGRGGRGYGRQPQGYNYEERGFMDRAGDEVRSWFGDEDAERRREMDARRDEQRAGERYDNERDSDYHSWRSGQIAALDRDYDEYRQQNRSKFENEFSTWRTGRQGQRDLLNKVDEHQEVVGSDGEHVGTVDKVRGDRVILTKNDQDAGGHHHSFPSSWLQSVDDKVTLSKTAAEAKSAWKDEERKGAMFSGDANRDAGGNRGTQTGQNMAGQNSAGQNTAGQNSAGQNSAGQNTAGGQGRTDLNSSFSGTY